MFEIFKNKINLLKRKRLKCTIRMTDVDDDDDWFECVERYS